MLHTPEVLGHDQPFILVEHEHADAMRARIESHNVAVEEIAGPGTLRKFHFPQLTLNEARNLMVLIELNLR